MHVRGRSAFVALLLVGSPLGLIAAGCMQGNVTESVDIESQRNLSGIAGPPTGNARPVDRLPRAVFGTERSLEALTYLGTDKGESRDPDPGVCDNASMDCSGNDSATGATAREKRIVSAGLEFWVTQHIPEEGVGPLHNQRRCLGCHTSADDVRRANLPNTPFGIPYNVIDSTVARASRQGITDYSRIGNDIRPETNAFTLFGDFDPVEGRFFPLMQFGGPLLHVKIFCSDPDGSIEFLPPVDIDVELRQRIDPNTGAVTQSIFRSVGERAGPPYIGRGLMEAVYAPHLELNADLLDGRTLPTTLPTSDGDPNPDPVTVGCGGDCISGRFNLGRASDAFQGGDPVVRVGRFGLRGAGPALFAFILGGQQGEIGITTALTPGEQPNYNNVGLQCDSVPDPELTLDGSVNVRALIRNLAPPEFDKVLLDAAAAAVQQKKPVPTVSGMLPNMVVRGAQLFGLDLEQFGLRMIPGNNPSCTKPDDPACYFEERAIAKDIQLGCAGCHVPILRTGASPAETGARHLSNVYAPIFSDLLLHNGGQYPLGVDAENLNPAPFELDLDGQRDPSKCYYGAASSIDPGKRPKVTQGNREYGTQSGFCQKQFWISRNLADFALPNQGIATGNEFRTPPLMGIGRNGPPHLHDARIFLNPYRPGMMVYSDATVVNKPFQILTAEDALRAAIEIHDLPAPPNGDYKMCPTPDVVPAQSDICSRNAMNRSESRLVMERFRRLSPDDQMAVIRFLQTL
jgi:hypothetical protein